LRTLVVVIVAALACIPCAGCGGAISPDELQRGVESLGAAAAEGRLVALDVAEDRTKTTFVRVEARDLGDEAVHEAEKLHDAQAGPGLAGLKAQAVRLAQDIDAALGDLQVSASDPTVARDVARRLDALSKRAQLLVDRL
jgi:hypothetical protein